jgi:hypothetical protein
MYFLVLYPFRKEKTLSLESSILYEQVNIPYAYVYKPLILRSLEASLCLGL